METKVDIPVYGDVCPRKQRRKRQKMLVTELLLDYAKNSTLHGLRYITEPGISVIENTILRTHCLRTCSLSNRYNLGLFKARVNRHFSRIFWGITFTISVVMCFLFIREIYRKWVETPVIVSLNEYIVPVGMVPFPSVTICPQQKIMSSRFNYSSVFEKFMNGTNDLDDESTTKVEDISLICSYGHDGHIERNCSNSSSIDNILEVSPTRTEVFDLCIWRGDYIYQCRGLFTKVLTQEGVCYNFNSLAANETFKYDSVQHVYSYTDSSTESKNWTVKDNYLNVNSDAYPWRGRTNGAEPDLQVTFKSSKNEHDTLCNGVNKGYKIYLQHPTDFPQSSLYYYAALPKQVSSLAIKFSMMMTSPSLKGSSSNVRKCFFPEDRPLRYFQIYTLSNCLLECQSNFTFKKCGCIWFHMPHNDSKSICTAKRSDCVKNALDQLAEQELKAEIDSDIPACRCFPACDSIHYDAEILKTDYDVQTVLKTVNDMYIRMGLADKDSTEIYDKTEEYSKIELYFKEPRFVSMRRSELYGRNEFLANCGGLLGLFLGFSFLSLVEIIYFTTVRLCCLLKRDLKAEKKNADKRND